MHCSKIEEIVRADHDQLWRRVGLRKEASACDGQRSEYPPPYSAQLHEKVVALASVALSTSTTRPFSLNYHDDPNANSEADSVQAEERELQRRRAVRLMRRACDNVAYIAHHLQLQEQANKVSSLLCARFSLC